MLTWARKVWARRASEPTRSGSVASTRPLSAAARVGEAPPVVYSARVELDERGQASVLSVESGPALPAPVEEAVL